MAFRTIETDIWGNAFFDGMKTAHKLLYIYLFSNQFITNIGVLEVTKARIAYETGTSVKVVNEFLAAMETRGQIVTDGELILVVKFIAKQTRFGSDAETNKNDKLLKNLTRLFCACPSRKIRRVLFSTYPNLFAGLETPSNKEGSHFAPEDKGLGSETEAPSFGEASPFLSEDKGLGSETEGVGGDIGDIGERENLDLPPYIPPTPDADAPAEESESEGEVPTWLNEPPLPESEMPLPEEASPQEPEVHLQAEPQKPTPKPKSKRKKADLRAEDFEAVWQAYPARPNSPDGGKGSKEAARKAWDKLCKANELPELDALLATLAWQKQTQKWQDGYIENFSKYLAEGHWKVEKPANFNPNARAAPQQNRFGQGQPYRGKPTATDIAEANKANLDTAMSYLFGPDASAETVYDATVVSPFDALPAAEIPEKANGIFTR